MDAARTASRTRRLRSVRVFLWLFVPLAVIVVAGAVLFARSEAERELSRLGAEEKFSVGLGSGSAARDMHWIVRDLAFLANHLQLRAAINDPSPANLDALAADWIAFARAQQDYDQIRWIDEHGMERVRVDFHDGSAAAVPADKLQYNGDRYYFTATRRIGPGEIFVSPLDLNVEHEKVEVPHRPTIRVGTPLIDGKGVRRGIVLLNYRAREMLQNFAEVTANIAGHVMLLNAQGYWLHSANPDDDWGFMFGRAETLATRYPEEWPPILEGDHDQFETATGMWTFDTVLPLTGADAVSIAPNGAPATERSAGLIQSYVWKVVSHVPAERLAAVRHAALVKTLLAALVLLGVVGFGIGQFALSAGRRAEVADALHRRTRDFEEAQRIANVGSWEWVASSGRATWSAELYRLQGRNPGLGPLRRAQIAKCLVRDSLRSLVRVADRAMKTGVPFEIDLEIVRGDGTHGWVTARGERLFDEAGALVGLRGTVHDITERKRMHERLFEAQKLEAVGQLTGGLAHDFNNLLGIILGNLDLLEPLLAHDSQALRYRSLAWRAAKRGAQITKSLLAIARKQTLEPRRVSVADALAEMMPLISQSLGGRISLTNSCADGRCQNVVAYVDPGGLGNAVLNLVVNARDAMPEGGALHIGLAMQEVGPEQPGVPADLTPGRYVVLSVSDTGTGMAEPVAARAFEPFFTTKERGQGTGLGLAMVYGFSRQSGGTATIASEPGIGTTVRLYLPAVGSTDDEPGVGSAAPREAQVRARGETVLVVDDEETLLEVTAEWLRRLGYRVTVKTSPVEALELLRSQTYDLLLTDATMPGMSGMDLAQQGLLLHPGMKVLVASGFAENLAHCGYIVLEKPYSRDQLAQAVRRVLDQPAQSRGVMQKPYEAQR